MHNPLAIANYFIELAKNDANLVSPMKLQKLVYFALGWCLALADKPLINEKVEAWQYGPVVGSLYREFKKYGNEGITSPAVEFKHLEGFKFANVIPTVEDEAIGQNIKERKKCAIGINHRNNSKYSWNICDSCKLFV